MIPISSNLHIKNCICICDYVLFFLHVFFRLYLYSFLWHHIHVLSQNEAGEDRHRFSMVLISPGVRPGRVNISTLWHPLYPCPAVTEAHNAGAETRLCSSFLLFVLSCVFLILPLPFLLPFTSPPTTFLSYYFHTARLLFFFHSPPFPCHGYCTLSLLWSAFSFLCSALHALSWVLFLLFLLFLQTSFCFCSHMFRRAVHPVVEASWRLSVLRCCKTMTGATHTSR